jgi:hypothetical protein
MTFQELPAVGFGAIFSAGSAFSPITKSARKNSLGSSQQEESLIHRSLSACGIIRAEIEIKPLMPQRAYENGP